MCVNVCWCSSLLYVFVCPLLYINNNSPKDRIEAEFGDVLFSIINAARLYDVEPDNALEKTNLKFIKRFKYLENKTIKTGKSLHDMSLAEMEKIWQKAKKYDE